VPEDIDSSGAFWVNPRSIRLPEAAQDHAGSLEIVVPYIGAQLTAKVVGKAASLTSGLNAALKLVAVYVAPYPSDLACPVSMRDHLTARLTEIAGRTTLPSTVHLVVARDRDAGFRHVLRPASAVLLGSHNRPWRTREEKLARELARAGHQVSLLHFD
jgi:hypothetical protein